jgi:ubiquinone biosynthesis protein COQ9
MTHSPGEPDPRAEMRLQLLHAALPHVPFDGWSQKALDRAADDIGVDRDVARLMFPEGAVEMIALFSARADEAMTAALLARPLAGLKVRERVALAVRLRIEANVEHREAARRAVAFLALPQHAPRGMRLAFDTADAIWRALGDAATDYNYYTKRLILAGVFSATVVYWLDDDSDGFADTWGFLERRIGDVMTFEKTKAKMSKLGEKATEAVRWFGHRRYGS